MGGSENGCCLEVTIREGWAVYNKYLFNCFVASHSIRFTNPCSIRNKHQKPIVIYSTTTEFLHTNAVIKKLIRTSYFLQFTTHIF